MYEVRNGQRVAPTCSTCGCRLMVMDMTLSHFYGDENHDARGCLCSQYNTLIIIESPNEEENRE